MKAGVYIIENKVNGKFYIGSSVHVARRFKSHRHALKNHLKSPPKLQGAWDKYGAEAFVMRQIVACRAEDVLMYEQLLIDGMNPYYNTRPVAESNFGIRWPKEVNMRKGRVRNEYTVRGVTGSLAALCDHFGVVKKDCARYRMYRGADVESAVLTPLVTKEETGKRTAATHRRNGTHPSVRTVTAFGVTAPIYVLIEKFAVVTERAVRRRLGLGWGIERALTEEKTR